MRDRHLGALKLLRLPTVTRLQGTLLLLIICGLGAAVRQRQATVRLSKTSMNCRLVSTMWNMKSEDVGSCMDTHGFGTCSWRKNVDGIAFLRLVQDHVLAAHLTSAASAEFDLRLPAPASGSAADAHVVLVRGDGGGAANVVAPASVAAAAGGGAQEIGPFEPETVASVAAADDNVPEQKVGSSNRESVRHSVTTSPTECSMAWAALRRG